MQNNRTASSGVGSSDSKFLSTDLRNAGWLDLQAAAVHHCTTTVFSKDAAVLFFLSFHWNVAQHFQYAGTPATKVSPLVYTHCIWRNGTERVRFPDQRYNYYLFSCIELKEKGNLFRFRSLPYWVFLMLLFSPGRISASSGTPLTQRDLIGILLARLKNNSKCLFYAASDNETDLHLDCYFGCENMFCHFRPQEQNCSDYSLTVRDHFEKIDSWVVCYPQGRYF